MSKLSFRARALDPSKQMPIYLAEELPDLPEYSAINRAVPQMPSGMEKEEESEHHLQRAICTGLIIPTPEVYTTDQDFYDNSYPPNYKMPRQMIHMQPLGLEQDVPDYDMDSADEAWMNQQSRRLDLTPLKFEQMMDRLEKSSGQTVVTLHEAKALLKQDDEISIAVYDYWLNKRLKTQHPLLLSVKTENRPGASSNNPYLAFRRRTEKMQTRKNRKNDETSYEKMLKLRRDLQRATTVLEMVKRREKTKREQLHLSIEIFEKRVQLRDFSGVVLSELSSSLKNSRPAFAPLYTNQYSHHSSSAGSTPTGGMPVATAVGVSGVLTPGLLVAGVNSTTAGSGHLYPSASQYLNSSSLAIDAINAGGSGSRKEKRQYKKRKHKLPRDKSQQHLQQQQQYLAGVGVIPASSTSAAATAAAVAASSSSLSAHHHPHLHNLHRQSSSPAANESNIETEEEEFGAGGAHQSHKHGSESEEESPFAFRRKQTCDYMRPLTRDGNWPWESKEEHGIGDTKYRFTLTSISHPRSRCIGFARRRLGRGGRVILDRVATNLDDFWSQLDYTVLESGPSLQEPKQKFSKPASPPTVVDLPSIHTVANTFTTSTAASNVATLTPATTVIKIEPNEIATTGLEVGGRNKSCSDDYDIDVDFDDIRDDDEHLNISVRKNTGNVTRDANYTSALTLVQRHRHHRHRRLVQNRLNETATTKRQKCDTVANNGEVNAPPAVPRMLLHRLAQSLERSSASGMSSFQLIGDRLKREKLNGDDVSDEVVVELVRQQQAQQQQRPNHRANNNMLNNNNNSSSNINKNVSVSEKFNVIKNESTSVPDIEVMALTIKQELIDCTSGTSADDSNEPLSSIQKTAATKEILDDEENVNLAQLSSLIRHTVKKEPLDMDGSIQCAQLTNSMPLSRTLATYGRCENDDTTTPMNQMEDVIRLRNLRNCKRQQSTCNANVFIDDNTQDTTDYMGSLSPTSSQRLDICNDLLSDIRRDWLHFRPKTPTDELIDSSDCKLPLLDGPNALPLVDWSQQTSIAVEMLRVPDCHPQKDISDSTRMWVDNSDDAMFVSSSFKYAELEPDAQLMQTVYALDSTRGTSKSPEATAAGNSNSGIDFNLSGDSLNDINLLGDETDENMLDNILQECQIDDIKTLNQATNFWNGILDGEAVDEVVGGDVETAAGLLDCIDDKKTFRENKRLTRAKGGKARCCNGTLGSSSFNMSLMNGLRDDAFFAKEHIQPEINVVKQEAPEELFASLPPPVPTLNDASRQATIKPPAQAQLVQTVDTIQPPQFVTQFTTLQPQAQQIQEVAALTNILTVAPTQQKLQPQQLQQQQHILQIQQPQLRSVAVQQLHHLQQQQQQRQQQMLLQMQRDLVSSSPVITQFVPTSAAATLRQHPTLTPIGSTASGNHMIYTTTSADGGAGPQKIYIQKASHATVATSTSQLAASSQVPSSNSLSTNALISLSNDSTQCTPAANVMTIDGNTIVSSSASITTSAPSVNIISTAGGQQVTVHSIGGVQHIGSSTMSTGSSVATPLIVTTAARNSQHLTQQQLVHGQPTQQIVWRQIGSTNTTGMLTTTTEATAAMTASGNKIVWASRPGQKRQLNGPDGATDINNKMLLNRKFSQRKIISQQQSQTQQQQQQPQQHQYQIHQITNEQIQQLQQQHQDDYNSAKETMTASASPALQQQQLPKVQMQGGKVIKMSSFPLLVSEMNVQQQSQQQKHNSAAIAANHNYSLQPTAIITSPSPSQQQGISGNKIFLTSSSAGAASGVGSTNFTIATASELQAAAAASNAQKINYKDLQNSNLKVNFVSNVGGGVSVQQGNVVMEAKSMSAAQQQQQQQLQQQTVVLNKATAASVQQQQLLQQHHLKMKRERILNIIGASSVDATSTTGNSTSTTTPENSKRVLYTSLLNMKPLQKNNAGQMQMQIGPGGMTHAVLRGRIANNQTIFTTNMRSVPINASVSNVQVATAVQNQSSTANQATLAALTTISTDAAGGGGGSLGNDVKMMENINMSVSKNNSNSNNNSASATSTSCSNNVTNNTPASTTINR